MKKRISLKVSKQFKTFQVIKSAYFPIKSNLRWVLRNVL